MTWIIIVLVFLIAFGPVFWLMPSQRDRRLSALRTQAREESLVVELRRLPKLHAKPEERVSSGGKIRQPVIECAAYLWNMPRRLRFIPRVRILRSVGENPAIPGWVFDPQTDPKARQMEVVLERIARYVDSFPEDVIGLEVSERQLACYWLESPGSTAELVAGIASELRRLSEDLSQVDQQLETDYLNPES